jgi:magnesium transporter
MVEPTATASAGRRTTPVIDVRVHTDHTGLRDGLALEHISDVLGQDDTLLWLDVTDPTPDELQVLNEEFAFHPLAMEDATKRHQRPKIDFYDGFLLLVFYEVALVGDRPQTRELTLFVGTNYLVTVHDTASQATIQETAQRWREQVSWQGPRTVGVLVHALLDAIVDAYFPVVDDISDRIEDLEEAIFDHVTRGAQQEIFALKKDLLTIRRVLAPERDVLNILVRRDSPIFGEEVATYFQDVYDHILRVTESVDAARDLLSSSLDAFLSVSSNHLNEIVKKLTVSSIILMSVTLIAGIYGMNFAHMPELDWRLGYPFALGLMLLVGSGLLLVFRQLDWF